MEIEIQKIIIFKNLPPPDGAAGTPVKEKKNYDKKVG